MGSKVHWKERYAKGGVCDFKTNYDFFFKWLLNKVASCFYIKNLDETVDEWYLKTNLLLDGDICITDFNDKLYACIGARGGSPDEYYVPTIFTVANPVLGSKQVEIGKNGVVIYNTATDKFYADNFTGGLYELINQTATLLADNIVSINSNQINSRVVAFFTAESKAQAVAAEEVLKQIYAGRPYAVLRSDLVEKLGVNPISTASTSSNITELVSLNNYIIGNFFQSIGIKSNNIRKNAHVLQEEIDAQDQYLQLSVLEFLTSWQKGFDEVNKLYNRNYQVELNPVLINEIIDLVDRGMSAPVPETKEEPVEVSVSETADTSEETTSEEPNNEVEEATPVEEEKTVSEVIEESSEEVEEIIDIINDSKEEGGDEDADETDAGEVLEQSDINE